MPRPRICFLRLSVIALLLAGAARAATGSSESIGAEPATPFAFQPGEQLRFDVSWGIFRRAGEIRVVADDEAGGGQKVTVEVESRGTISRFYRYDATGTSWFDGETGRILRSEYIEQANTRQRHRSMNFDYETGQVDYRDAFDPEKNTTLPIPEGDPLDLVTSLVSVRQWDLEPGETRDIIVQADRRFYALRLRAEAWERVDTPLGEFEALKIVPEPIGPPEGLFRRGGRIELWVGKEEPRLPLRIAVQMKVGTAVAALAEYRNPSAGVVAESERPPSRSVGSRTSRVPLKKAN